MKTILEDELKKDDLVKITGALQTCQIYAEWVDTFVKRKKDRKKWASYLRLAGEKCSWNPSVGAVCRVITVNRCLHDSNKMLAYVQVVENGTPQEMNRCYLINASCLSKVV